MSQKKDNNKHNNNNSRHGWLKVVLGCLAKDKSNAGVASNCLKLCQSLGYPRANEEGAVNTTEYIAQDSALCDTGMYRLFNSDMLGAVPHFLGYGMLTQLVQNGLIQRGVLLRANEMTSKWIELKRTGETTGTNGDRKERKETLLSMLEREENKENKQNEQKSNTQDDKNDNLIQDITAELERLKIRKLFHDASELCGYYGGCLAYIDLDGDTTDDKLRTPLYLDEATFKPGTLKGFKLIEPVCISPGECNYNDPIAKDYFTPQTWFVMGKEIHASRFLYFSESQLPALLRPSYNFFGIPLAQTVFDVVTHFTECREAEMRLIKKFSMTVLKTDMSSVLQDGRGEDEVSRRVQYMVQNRDNDGVETIDVEEEISHLETTLTGVTDVVRQAMEMVAAYFGEPAVKLWGLSPNGFNSTGESDMKNHYDHIASVQETMFRAPLDYLLRILQYNLNGKIEDDLTFRFVSLDEETEAKVTESQKNKAELYRTLLEMEAVSPEEVRKVLSEDPKSPFANIDIDDVPSSSDELEDDIDTTAESADNPDETLENSGKDSIIQSNTNVGDAARRFSHSCSLSPSEYGEVMHNINNNWSRFAGRGQSMIRLYSEANRSWCVYYFKVNDFNEVDIYRKIKER